MHARSGGTRAAGEAPPRAPKTSEGGSRQPLPWPPRMMMAFAAGRGPRDQQPQQLPRPGCVRAVRLLLSSVLSMSARRPQPPRGGMGCSATAAAPARAPAPCGRINNAAALPCPAHHCSCFCLSGSSLNTPASSPLHPFACLPPSSPTSGQPCVRAFADACHAVVSPQKEASTFLF